MTIEARSVNQGNRFKSDRAYELVAGSQSKSMVGPVRFLAKTVDKLLPVKFMCRDENQGIVLDSCRSQTAQQLCVNALRSMNIKGLR